MSKTLAFIAAALLGCSAAFGSNSAEHAISLTKRLSARDLGCISRVLPMHFRYPGDHSKDISDLLRIAKVGHAVLGPRHHQAYIFLFEDRGYCGSAGCMLMVGEERRGRICKLIYESDGFAQAITVSDKRDHGYRRLYTPCEARFDGKQYQQIRIECPTAKIHR